MQQFQDSTQNNPKTTENIACIYDLAARLSRAVKRGRESISNIILAY
jgi:hypothetical protein